MRTFHGLHLGAHQLLSRNEKLRVEFEEWSPSENAESNRALTFAPRKSELSCQSRKTESCEAELCDVEQDTVRRKRCRASTCASRQTRKSVRFYVQNERARKARKHGIHGSLPAICGPAPEKICESFSPAEVVDKDHEIGSVSSRKDRLSEEEVILDRLLVPLLTERRCDDEVEHGFKGVVVE